MESGRLCQVWGVCRAGRAATTNGASHQLAAVLCREWPTQRFTRDSGVGEERDSPMGLEAAVCCARVVMLPPRLREHRGSTSCC